MKKCETHNEVLTMMYIVVTKLLKINDHKHDHLKQAFVLVEMVVKSIEFDDFILVTKNKLKFVEAITNLTPNILDNNQIFENCFKIFTEKLKFLKTLKKN